MQLDANLEIHQADCGISIEASNTDYEYIHLISEEKVLVCSPELLKQLNNSPYENLNQFSLLLSDDMNEWIKVFCKLKQSIPEKKYHFSHAILLQQAAIEGQGIALCAESIVRSDINSGLLTKIPLNMDEKIITHFYFCVIKDRFNDPSIQSLLNWLKSCF